MKVDGNRNTSDFADDSGGSRAAFRGNGDGLIGGEVVNQGHGAVGPLDTQFGDAGGGAEAEVG